MATPRRIAEFLFKTTAEIGSLHQEAKAECDVKLTGEKFEDLQRALWSAAATGTITPAETVYIHEKIGDNAEIFNALPANVKQSFMGFVLISIANGLQPPT